MIYKDIVIAPAKTHHLQNGKPFYTERFDEVLKFHPPGLASVRKGTEAWHISLDGRAVYERRFRRTFCFYEGKAAVISEDGWHHISPDGGDLYSARYSWCGNFQEGRCPVRDSTGNFYHIAENGTPVYEEHWRYAGDFRDGIAVVQSENGQSTHIDRMGYPIHGRWFLDLDVFHKGFARARDADGWMHVDLRGAPIYQRRFASVEPFYNGQARVERFDGGLEVINEAGETVIELRPALRSEFSVLSSDLVGFWRTQTIFTAVKLGIFNALPCNTCKLAEKLGLRADRLERLLRALGELNLVKQSNAEWRVTKRGTLLRSSNPMSLSGAAVEYSRYLFPFWESLPDALQKDNHWTEPDVFRDVAASSERILQHHKMLSSYAKHDYEQLPDVLDLKGLECLVDAGGGLGVLAKLLVERYPRLRMIVLDRPEVVEFARQQSEHPRIEFYARDLFDSWRVKADAVVLARVLHDWEDEQAEQILRNAHAALRLGGQVFIVEMLLEEGTFAGALCDLHLLVVTGGKERRESEYSVLLRRAGFEFVGVKRIAAFPSVVVGEVR